MSSAETGIAEYDIHAPNVRRDGEVDGWALTELLNCYSHFTLDPEGSMQVSSGLGQGIISLPLIVDPVAS